MRSGTALTLRIPTQGRARVSVHDITGRRVAMLVDALYLPGIHTVAWSGRDRRGETVPSSRYLVRLETQHGTDACKLWVTR